MGKISKAGDVAIHLEPISASGCKPRTGAALPPMAAEILEHTASLYAADEYRPPWVAYLAVRNGAYVGFGTFKSAPKDGRVEIAYAVFPPHEGRGLATAIARRLIEIAWSVMPGVEVLAQTLRQENGSTAVLRKLGFEFGREVRHPEDGLVWEWRLSADQVRPTSPV